MATTTVTGPDGKDYDVTHPEGASDNEILQYAQRNYGAGVNTPSTTERWGSPTEKAMAQLPGSSIGPERDRGFIGNLAHGEAGRMAMPAAGAVAGSMIPVPGVGPAVGSALMAALGAGGFEYLRQALAGEPTQPGRIGTEVVRRVLDEDYVLYRFPQPVGSKAEKPPPRP